MNIEARQQYLRQAFSYIKAAANQVRLARELAPNVNKRMELDSIFEALMLLGKSVDKKRVRL